MSLEDIYKIAAAYVSEKPQKSEIKNLVLIWINAVLEECLPWENAQRRAKGKNVLKTAPVINSFGDVIDYDEKICKIALPYKIASLLFSNDEEDYKSALYENKYIDALGSYTKAIESEAVDLY